MKEYLSLAELCGYLDVSKSYIYKLSHYNILPKYCPTGKLIYFKRSEVDAWLEQGRVPSQQEIESDIELQNYKAKKC